MNLDFKNRVVIVTGAGGGLGKAYAVFFGSKGASVVVNDLGGSRSGDGSGNNMAADLVVKEITDAGGKAISDYNSVLEGDKIVQTALRAFGRVDILINNAGILRDRSFSRMSDADWDLVLDVHLNGSYKVAKAAWEVFQKQGFGRIINTSSAAGIYGNFGQANYSAAKLALHGLTMSLAREGAKKNIFVNTIAPLAASRMTETVMPPEMLANLNPSFIVPVVAYLCHDSSTENGSIFEAAAGYVAKLRYERSKGFLFKSDPTFTPGSVSVSLNKIHDFHNATYPGSITEVDWIGLIDQAKSIKSNPIGPDTRFDGKVVLITGAGAGLGRAYAHLFAKYGASVIVNDLGTSHTGTGAGSSAADTVVSELQKAYNAKAVANYDSVENGEKLVETAIKTFGRIDIVVNNAGILRDKSFARMSDSDWDIVQRVHLRGTYKVLKAAWPYMLKQKYGRIINTTSAVGLYGNFGQANYSAAKAGIIALGNTLALEGRKSNILVNTIAPNAGTRMTATIMPPEMVEALKPDYIAPLVVALSHESITDLTGGVYEVGSGWISKVRWQRSAGVGFPVNLPLSIETVASNWKEITNFENGRATYPLTTADSFTAVQANFDNISKGSVGSKTKTTDAVSIYGPVEFEYGPREVILYALGVNAKRTDLNLVYENAENFITIPGFSVCVAFNAQMQVPFGDLLPNFNPMMLLHGEQYTEYIKPLPTSGKFLSTAKVVEIIDKGKSAIIVIGVTTKCAKTGEIYSENQFINFVRGSGGFGGSSKSIRVGPSVAANDIPNRPADKIVVEKTGDELAALYRLSGDYNPLHIDPQMSAIGGFNRPILHGLCSFGIAIKVILREYGGNNPSFFKNSKVRFAKHFFPGETAEIHMWKEQNRVLFQVKVVERNEIVISNAAVELNEALHGKSVENKATVASIDQSVVVNGFLSSNIFAAVDQGIKSLSPEAAKSLVTKTKGVFEFKITNKDGKVQEWHIDLKNGASVSTGSPKSPADMIVSIADADFVDLATGKTSAQKAFMAGKIKIKGNMAMANKLEAVLKLGSGKAKL